jgi:hypothetical protein
MIQWVEWVERSLGKEETQYDSFAYSLVEADAKRNETPQTCLDRRQSWGTQLRDNQKENVSSAHWQFSGRNSRDYGPNVAKLELRPRAGLRSLKWCGKKTTELGRTNERRRTEACTQDDMFGMESNKLCARLCERSDTIRGDCAMHGRSSVSRTFF